MGSRQVVGVMRAQGTREREASLRPRPRLGWAIEGSGHSGERHNLGKAAFDDYIVLPGCVSERSDEEANKESYNLYN